MTLFLTVLHVTVCILLIVVILLQQGKGAEIGAVFGGGASSTVFGSRGAGNFFTRLTAGAAILFMVTSLSLSVIGAQSVGESILDEDEAAPAAAESFQEIPLETPEATAPAGPGTSSSEPGASPSEPGAASP